MLRGVSGGQKKRVTTGEMVVGPRKTLFMDEISTGLDSSTTFHIVKCIRNSVHIMEGTVLMSLLQPAPETFDLFDDLILLCEGYIVYQGPRSDVVEFFESLGFRLPPRKNVADFLQEVTSIKDQAQYWGDHSKPYEFVPVSKIAEEFRNSRHGQNIASLLSNPYDKSKGQPSTLPKTKYAVPRTELFKTCFNRELLLISRHRFLYTIKIVQVAFIGFVTCTTFLRTRVHPIDEANGDLYLACLYYGLMHIMFSSMFELPLMILQLPVFYKQRDNNFYPAWAWSLSSFILRVPYSIVQTIVWSGMVYYTVGFAPGAGRFLASMFLLFVVHQVALGLFRTVASVARDVEAAIERFSVPPANSEPLKFNSTYAKDSLSQFLMCLRKQKIVYWRSPLYNVVRIFFTTICAFIIGTMFWRAGNKRGTTQHLFVLMGALYCAASFLGINNATSVQPVVSIERTVFYREKAAGMYSPFPFAFAQGIVEIPYIFLQTVIFSCITYYMIYFEIAAGNFFLYMLFMFLTFTYYTFFGIMVIGLIPNQQVASVCASAFFSLWNLLSGFLVPKPKIPGWWIWFYYICPQSWTLQGIITSQLGNVETRVVGPGYEGTVKDYIKEYYGFDSDMVGASVGVLIGFCLLFFGVFAISVKILNFQRR